MKKPTAIFHDQEVNLYIDKGGLGAETACRQIAYAILPGRRSTGEASGRRSADFGRSPSAQYSSQPMPADIYCV